MGEDHEQGSQSDPGLWVQPKPGGVWQPDGARQRAHPLTLLYEMPQERAERGGGTAKIPRHDLRQLDSAQLLPPTAGH